MERPLPVTLAAALDEGPAPRPRALSLRANFLWTLAGNLVYAACQWGMLVTLAKLGSPEMVGQFALGLAVTAPVLMFANLNLRHIQATDATREYRFGDYFGLRLITTAAALLVISGIVLAAGYSRETALVVLAVGVAKAFESISDVFHGLLQQHECMDRVARSLIIKGPLSLAALGVATWLSGSVVWGVIALAASWAVVLLAYDARSAARVVNDGALALRPVWSRHALAELARLTLPLGIVMALASLSGAVPRYFVEHHLGAGALGIFAAITYFQVAGSTVVGALAQSASPRLAAHYARGEQQAFCALIAKLVAIGLVLGTAGVLVAAVAGKPILALLYSPEYAGHAGVLVWTMVAAAAGYAAWFMGTAMTASRCLRAQVPLFAVVAGSTALACFWLVPVMGLTGAAVAVLIGACIQLSGGLAIVLLKLRKS